MGAGLLAKAVDQSKQLQLTDRIREQARLCLDLGINSEVRGVDGKL